MPNGRMYLNPYTLKLIDGKVSKAKASVSAEALAERGRNLSALNKARKIAATIGVDIDKDSQGGWWVTCSSFAESCDPLDGNHFCASGSEVLQAVAIYQEALTQPKESK